MRSSNVPLDLQGKSICSSSGSAGVDRGALWDAMLGECSQELSSAHTILSQVLSRSLYLVRLRVRGNTYEHDANTDEHHDTLTHANTHTRRWCRRTNVP